ncbi:MAG TPA: phosphatase PAP2 family protein [Anaeromyxobacteraceae bacterium]|nr:phosphatase PAP2 family protein [Anaeromyxobacteraceae bacterium]
MRPSERLSAAFLLALAAAAAASRPPGAALLAAAFLTLAAAVTLLSRAGDRGPAWSFARDLFPVPVVVAIFMLLQPVIEGVNPARWDATFAAFDARYLPGLVQTWRNLFGRPAPLTDAAYLAYVSYYLLPVVVAVAVRSRAREAYERTVFAIVLSFYLSFAGYFLFPTSGPRLPRELEAETLGGGPISAGVRAFLHAAEATRLDAFPSGHTAASLVAAATASRAFPRATPLFLAWAAAIVFATVYIHVHYAVDILAGALLAGATLAAAPAASRAIARIGAPADASRR